MGLLAPRILPPGPLSHGKHCLTAKTLTLIPDDEDRRGGEPRRSSLYIKTVGFFTGFLDFRARRPLTPPSAPPSSPTCDPRDPMALSRCSAPSPPPCPLPGDPAGVVARATAMNHCPRPMLCSTCWCTCSINLSQIIQMACALCSPAGCGTPTHAVGKNIPVRALSSALPQPSPPTRTLTPIPHFASGCMAAGLGHQKIPFGI